MRVIRVLSICLAFLIVIIGQLVAAPLTLNHQGLLTDNGGTPLSGSFSMTFKLYAVSTSGTALWSETQIIIATDGLYQATLGQTTPINPSLFSNDPKALYLGITVGTDSELTPRTELSSIPYSLHSSSVEGFSPGPNNVNNGQYSFVGGDNNTNQSELSSILGGEDNEINITEFADTLFDTSGLSPFGFSSGSSAVHPPGSGTILGGHGNIVCGNHSVIVQGWLNINCAPYSFLGTGFRNTIYAWYSTIGTGIFNDINAGAHYSVIGGGAVNKANSFASVISGGAINTTTAGTRGETIGGGWRNRTDKDFSTISGGENNHAIDSYSTIGGGQTDTALGSHSTIAGGLQNYAEGAESSIGGGSVNRTEGVGSTISGGNGNATAINDYQTIGGGQGNRAMGDFATIGGGQANQALDVSTVGGGRFNFATSDFSTIGGGLDNISSNFATAVAGGTGNTASGYAGSIGGGENNSAGPGEYATVPGGYDNDATAPNSFAAGRRAKAVDSCSFVWADCCQIGGIATTNPYYSSINNSFNARATNGFYFLTSCDSTFDPASGVGSGVYVPPGGSMWMTGSSRTLKKNITEVDGADILDRIDQMPIYRWSYKNQSDDVEHIGPMAEDFYEAFDIGENERTIGALDPAGVSLAATKALIKENKELKDRLEKLESLVGELLDKN